MLSAFSENRLHAGPVGAGQKLKLLHNFVSLGGAVLLSEAAACAAENDIAPEVLVDCLRQGGGYGTALDRVAPYLLDGDAGALRFTNANARKDLGYYDALAKETGTYRGVAAGVLEALEWLCENAGAGRMLPEASRAFGRRDTP
ncbi:MAG: NAD-binding protein [Paracoccaceae bacterium]